MKTKEPKYIVKNKVIRAHSCLPSRPYLGLHHVVGVCALVDWETSKGNLVPDFQ